MLGILRLGTLYIYNCKTVANSTQKRSDLSIQDLCIGIHVCNYVVACNNNHNNIIKYMLKHCRKFYTKNKALDVWPR